MTRLLVDAGPLIAVLDAGDAAHADCVAVLERERGRLVSTWPAITEALYLLRAQLLAVHALLQRVEAGDLEVAGIDDLVPRVRVLLEKYHSVPMDFADATLVAVAEREKLDRIFTLDDDFRIYRIGGRRAFTILP